MNNRQTSTEKSGLMQFFLKSWQPVPTIKSTLLIFSIIGLGFIIFGIVLTVVNSKIVEAVSEPYWESCKGDVNCEISLKVPSEMKPPIYVFYELHNFYQNHRRYIKSKSNNQLAGKDIDLSTATSSCDPIVRNKDIKPDLKSWDGIPLDAEAVANPCGLIAKSFFNDKYQLFKPTGENVTIDITGISWPQDKGTKFKAHPDSAKLQWINPENEHFIVWMRTAGLPDFRKLWGKINDTLPAGTYKLKITNLYNTTAFKGKKLFVLSTTGPFGGINRFLEYSYYIVGGICLLIAIAFFVRNRMTGGKFGDIQAKTE